MLCICFSWWSNWSAWKIIKLALWQLCLGWQICPLGMLVPSDSTVLSPGKWSPSFCSAVMKVSGQCSHSTHQTPFSSSERVQWPQWDNRLSVMERTERRHCGWLQWSSEQLDLRGPSTSVCMGSVTFYFCSLIGYFFYLGMNCSEIG